VNESRWTFPEVLGDHWHAWRLRQLCDEANPDVEQRDAYRRLVHHLAIGEPIAAPIPPPIDSTYASRLPPLGFGPCGGCPG
jgi:hypothetical protein